VTPAGVPRSEIHGSKRVCRSPWLIAACRVLHRRLAPRHPPFTLSSLAIKYFRRESYKIFAFKKFANHSILLSKTDLKLLGFLPRGNPGSGSSRKMMVELIGIEPTTYGLQSRRSPN